jgi:hypothetical protein
MAASMRMITFWYIVECRLVEVDPHFRGAYSLLHQDFITAMMEAVRNSEMWVYFKRAYTPLYTRRLSSSKSVQFLEDFSPV